MLLKIEQNKNKILITVLWLMREKKYQAEQRRLTVNRLRHKLRKFELVPTAGEAVPSGFEAITIQGKLIEMALLV